MLEIIKKLKKEDLTDYKSIPFWSWNNKLNKKELVNQINSMHKAGHGGFIMHARTGLKTEYLSEEWFDCVRICLQEAKKLKMNAWMYDENGWPSGFVGGKLLEEKENLAKYLMYKINDYFDTKALSVYNIKDDTITKIDKNTILKQYHTIYLNLSPANTDILDAKVVEKFINLTYEQYFKRFNNSFGKEFTGFFTDEPQYFRYATPYTTDAENTFKKMYNEDIFNGLLYLFLDTEKGYQFRVKYYQMMNYLYIENYYKKLYLWCEEHNCKFTGHSVEETKLFTQMWGCADCSTSYEYEHIPAIDNLAKYSTAQLSARQVGSVAAQLSKKQVLTETFGCSGYDATPRELKHIAERQYVHGVNLMCQHLMPYSLAGQGKVDHPPCFSKHMMWWNEYKLFNDYFTRLGFMLAESKDLINVGIIHPIQSVYLKYFRDNEEPCFEFDIELEKLQSVLQENNINYHLINETILQKYGKISENSLQIEACKYNYIIIPYCLTLKASTANILKEYVEKGGNIYCYDKPKYIDGQLSDFSYLKTNCTLEEIKKSNISIESNGKISYTYRSARNERFIYVLNEDDKAITVTLPKRSYSKLNLEKLKLFSINRTFILEKNESAIIFEQKSTAKEDVFNTEKDITKNFIFDSCTKNSLIVDIISISYDGINYDKPSYVSEVFERLVKADYKGKLFVKYVFNVKDLCKMKLIKEKNKAKDQKLNGKEITFKQSKFDVNFIETDISEFIKTGLNEFTYHINYEQNKNLNYALFDENATESLRNCLAFKTEIESIYIEGNFEINTENKIVFPVYNIKNSEIEKSGYPFFAGEMIFNAAIFSEKKKAKLKIYGNYAVANLVINGRKYSGAVLSDEFVVDNLNIGENKITLILKSSLRNKFGPHHTKQKEDDGVSPFTFTMRGTWKNGKSDFFDNNYKIVKFGLDKIMLSFPLN